MRFVSFAKIAAAMAVIATVLAACVVVEDGPGQGPRPPFPPRGEGGMCTREYAPVCGQRGDERRTFGNSCMARSEGFRIIDQGECRRGGSSGGGGWGRPPQQACTMDHRPVCGQRGGDRQTFSNACQAEAGGYRVVSQGECRRGGGNAGGGGWGDRPPQRACTREYAPVCARRGRDMRTFGNSCEAESAEYRVVRSGSC